MAKPTLPTTSGRKYGVAESLRSSSALQLAIANRARLVLSLLDQRADLPADAPHLSHPVVAAGLNTYVDRQSVQSYTTVSRLVRSHRRWTPDLLLALVQWAQADFGLTVDPGWLTYGDASAARPPEIPKDCRLRPETTTDGLAVSARSLRVIRSAERRGG
ncbi:hypothetical protein [Gemmatimonas sp.]